MLLAVSLALGNEVVKQTSVPVLSHGATQEQLEVLGDMSSEPTVVVTEVILRMHT